MFDMNVRCVVRIGAPEQKIEARVLRAALARAFRKAVVGLE